MDFTTCGCGRFRVWGGWSLESDDEKSLFFPPPAFLSRAGKVASAQVSTLVDYSDLGFLSDFLG